MLDEKAVAQENQELRQLLRDLLEAMRSENTPCPYCYGRIAHPDRHDDTCTIPELVKKLLGEGKDVNA